MDMDNNLLWTLEKRVERTLKNLEKNNMEGYFVKDKEELIEKIGELIKEDSIVSVGGSVTLKETGILEFLRNGKYNFLDRYKENLKTWDIDRIYRETFFADTFISSTNALTEYGELYNVDGNGNRVAAMIYGPKQVIIVVGINKIVKDMKEAENRLKFIACPANAKRLNKNTPCAKSGYCMECNSEDRICSHYVVMRKQKIKNRIKVIIVQEMLGY